MKRVLVNGAGGFIGGHLVKRLKNEGYWVRAVDLKANEYAPSTADEFIVGDLRSPEVAKSAVDGVEEGISARRRYGRSRSIFSLGSTTQE